MARTSELPHDFPDRAIRDAVLNPKNLRELVRRLFPDLVDKLDFSRVEVVNRSYLLDDWRRREADVLVRLPFRDSPSDESVMICVLVEHWSTPDPVMPLRVLLYAVLFWEQEWKAWETSHPRGQPLRLTPVLPVVLHTGLDGWKTNRSLAELFAGPESVQAWAPRWQVLLWDMVDHNVAELLQGDEAFWQALAIIRSEQADADQFLTVLQEVLQRLEALGQQEPMRWQQLLRLVLYWSLYRRPGWERPRVLETVQASHRDVALQQEVQTMVQQLEPTYEEELAARFEARGELAAHRAMLQRLLLERFQSLPDSLLERIAASDLAHLQAAVVQVLYIRTLDELEL